MAYRIGIDIGGTFTDFSIFDTANDSVSGFKVATVPAAPVDGVEAGLRRLFEEHAVAPQAIEYVVHGTTIAVNALIERKGARLGMLVTRGFRDLLIIQRLRIPEPQNWYGKRPSPLVPRERIYEIEERLNADGTVHTGLAEATLGAALERARAEHLDGLVVCFLHAFRNPEHERAAAAFMRAHAPELFVCCSHEVWPQMREYERAILTIVNAYVTPPVRRYLGALLERLDALGIAAEPYITRSNGGIMTVRQAQSSTVETLLSGPASGVMGAVRTCAQMGIEDFITLDVGGTSADVAIVQGGMARTSTSEHVADFPIMMPVVGVSSIGAGGGSIASVDDARVLRVGPQSAGADPGPACYDKGNDRATLTDAFLAAGLIDPVNFAGGRLTLAPERAQRAIATLAQQLRAEPAAAIEGILAIAVAAMYAELSNLSARHGIDPREYALVAFGGAGPLLACRLAEEVGMQRVLIPLSPGTLCAYGALSADVASDFVRSLVLHLTHDVSALADAHRELVAAAQAWLASEAPTLADHRLLTVADMRYVGQSYEVEVPLDPDTLARADRAAILDAFHRTHRAIYAHADEAAPAEVINLRVRIVGAMPKPAHAELRAAQNGSRPVAAGTRSILLGSERRSVPVFARSTLLGGQQFDGPALIDQPDSTVAVPAGWRARVHPSGSLLLERGL